MNENHQESVVLRVSGMTCQDCVMHVKKAILSLDGVSEAKVDLKTGDANVVYEPDRVKPEDMLALRIFRPPSHYRASIKER
ncbi:MAG: heavy-metal-associated domain-containing protein [Thermoplasmata archaeon]|uniref:Heavy-metal-associated domain-containing protein n=2 Tax=Candidatus Sysuiplasma superficiale TaxID=2823368 RepID=A0A8J7YT17_9ARCH|nr:heavy-metal-associated domain-containing protein [Candidatus Sysuiplasma superficiale]